MTGYKRYLHIQQGKAVIRKNAIQFIRENLLIEVYTNKSELVENLIENYE